MWHEAICKASFMKFIELFMCCMNCMQCWIYTKQSTKEQRKPRCMCAIVNTKKEPPSLVRIIGRAKTMSKSGKFLLFEKNFPPCSSYLPFQSYLGLPIGCTISSQRRRIFYPQKTSEGHSKRNISLSRGTQHLQKYFWVRKSSWSRGAQHPHKSFLSKKFLSTESNFYTLWGDKKKHTHMVASFLYIGKNLATLWVCSFDVYQEGWEFLSIERNLLPIKDLWGALKEKFLSIKRNSCTPWEDKRNISIG